MPRSGMASLITRVRILINDTLLGTEQIFTDDQIQDVLDESRENVTNKALRPEPTYSGSTIQYLNYYSDFGGWEDDYVLKQYMTVLVTPSAVEPIAGHFAFTDSLFPSVYITGKRYDIYCAAADLLERRIALVAFDYDVTVGGQTFKRSQAAEMIGSLVKSYRRKQRPRSIGITRSDLNGNGQTGDPLAPTALDYMASGNG